MVESFGTYINKMLTIDALFLNEDRHTHNIGVLRDPCGKYYESPIFDNGAALLSDTTMDYPVGIDTYRLISNVKAKTFSDSFDEQLDIAEDLFGRSMKFSFSMKDVEELLAKERYYSKEIKSRVYDIISHQRRKYEYLFTK